MDALGSGPDSPQKPSLLVLGYQGTLRPDGDDSDEPIPPRIDETVTPFVIAARARVEARTTREERVPGGEPVSLDFLIDGLRLRLAGILTLAVAADEERGLPCDANLLREYPALGSLLRGAAAEWADAAVTFLHRLHRDAPKLARWMGREALPAVREASSAASDLHPGGHGVIRIVFETGECVYYKPRAVTGEWLWHGLIAEVSRCDSTISLPSARVLAEEDKFRYGWVASVCGPDDERMSRRDGPEIAASYWRSAGALLCLAQHARLTDLHLGNIMATRRGPAVTDAECFATPALCGARSWKQDEAGMLDSAVDAILGTGLLPGGTNGVFPDTSGLFGMESRADALHLPRWRREPDGRFHLMNVPARLLAAGNSPGGTTPIAVLPDLMAGYRQGYEALLRIRDGLLRDGSQWRTVLEKIHAPRVPARDTLFYALLLSESLSPELTRSPDRQRRLLHSRLECAEPRLREGLIRAEVHAAIHLHVPRFVIPAGTRSLASSSGHSLSRKFVCDTPSHTVKDSLRGLSFDALHDTHLPALMLAVFASK